MVSRVTDEGDFSWRSQPMFDTADGLIKSRSWPALTIGPYVQQNVVSPFYSLTSSQQRLFKVWIESGEEPVERSARIRKCVVTDLGGLLHKLNENGNFDVVTHWSKIASEGHVRAETTCPEPKVTEFAAHSWSR